MAERRRDLLENPGEDQIILGTRLSHPRPLKLYLFHNGTNLEAGCCSDSEVFPRTSLEYSRVRIKRGDNITAEDGSTYRYIPDGRGSVRMMHYGYPIEIRVKEKKS